VCHIKNHELMGKIVSTKSEMVTPGLEGFHEQLKKHKKMLLNKQ